MKTLQLKSIAKWLPILLLPLLFAACSDNDEPETPDTGKSQTITPAQMAYSTLAGNYFNTDEPSVGTALDEAKPNELSKVAETVELALEDFERYLPKNKDTEQFIHRSGNTVSVELDTLGSVKFEPASGDGIVARVEINLKEKQGYTVLYRTKASYSENNEGSIFSTTYHPGDLVEVECWTKLDDSNYSRFCYGNHSGVVIEVSDDEMYVFTLHRHKYSGKCKYRVEEIEFDRNCVSLEGWQKIYDAWHDYRGNFVKGVEECWYYPHHSTLYSLFESDKSNYYLPSVCKNRYVCIDGNNLWIDYEGRSITSSSVFRLEVKYLREGNFWSFECVPYIDYWNGCVVDIDCAYYCLIKVDYRNANTLSRIWSAE